MAIKSLQIEGLLKSNEPPIERYEYMTGNKNRKSKTETNPPTSNKLFFFWISKNRGTLAIPHEVPHPSDRAHTMTMIPKLLDMMSNHRDDLVNWGRWTMTKFPNENCSLRTQIDGDFLQTFVALQKCGIFEVYP